MILSTPPRPHGADRKRRAPTAWRALAGSLVVAGLVAATVAACSTSSSTTASPDTQSSFSITIPPGAVVGGSTPDLNAGSVPDAGGSGLDSGPSTSVAAGNEDFCMII